ncbi:MAG: sodium-dependent transporter, partial [Gammaproteobacteria bacterium]
WLLGLGTVFSFNIWSDFKIFDRTIFDLLDYLTANLMLPLGGFFVAIFAGWVMRQKDSEEELRMGSESAYRIWKFLACYVSPAAVFLVFLNVIGLI